MPADHDVLRSARNAFLLVLVTLVLVSTYQFATIGTVTTEIAIVWVVGAGGFYASKWYYGRSEAADEAAGTTEND